MLPTLKVFVPFVLLDYVLGSFSINKFLAAFMTRLRGSLIEL